ncbi:cysteine desulfurylase family member [Holotrichia oblita]|nr:cysteine desulfurylase family member [Holotrichia oblita]
MSEKKVRFVYADNAATTPPHPEVVREINKYLTEGWGNPSSLYGKGRDAKHAITDARERISSHLGCSPNELYFTSCGTESDNWAIKGAVSANRGRNHIITSAIEHPAVLNTCKSLEKQGMRVTYAGVDSDGFVNIDEIKSAISEDTLLVAVMLANNEIGTIQPIREIADIAHRYGALMFTDAVQAVGSIPVNVSDLGADLLAMSGHKMHAPKGVGALYIKKGTKIANLIDGGGQESKRRGGTENVPYIMGFAKALDIACDRMADTPGLIKMRDRVISELSKIPHSKINGHLTRRLPGNVNIAFEYIEGESMLLLLDMAGICVSTGSACSSNSLEPSHVLLSIGVPHEKAHGSLRISLSHDNTDEEIDYILEILPPIVERLRAMSPIYPGNQI